MAGSLSVVRADPVVAFSNLPPLGSFKTGGTLLGGYAWKAEIFTTSAAVEVVEIKVGMSCSTCRPNNEIYPSSADLQVSLFSVNSQSGELQPGTELYSLPMQYGLVLTGRGTMFTFSVPNWRLNPNTSYAVVLKSTDVHPVKWGNIEVGGTDTAPVPQNGFSFSAKASFTYKLPGNFTLDPTSGAIEASEVVGVSGGSFSATIEMTQPGTAAEPVTVPLTINVVAGDPPPLNVTYPNYTGATGAGPINIWPTVSRASILDTVTYSVVGGQPLPNGLSLNPSTGEITGTPTASTGGIVSVSIQGITGGGAATDTVSVQFDIAPPSPGLTARLQYPDGLTAYVGHPFSSTPVASYLTGTPQFSVLNPSPPLWAETAANNNALEMKVLFVPSLIVDNSQETYSGSAIAAVVSCSSGGAVSNIQYNGSSTAPTDAGTYAVTANCAANGSYSALTDAPAGSLVISAATPAVTILNSQEIYTGSAIAATVSCQGDGLVSNVQYNGSSTVPTDAGTYAITADCAASSNYIAVTDAPAGSLVISAATPAVTILNSQEIYSGSAIAATVSCQGGGLVSNIQYNGSSTVPTDAGTYAITADCAASSNYIAVTDAPAGSLVISAATPAVTILNSQEIYSGSAIAATVSCQGGGLVSNIQYNGSSTVPTDAGTYAITADCAASSNFIPVTDAPAGSLVISAATPGVTILNSQEIYSGSAIAATVSCQGGGLVSNVQYNGSSTVPTDAGTYAITADCAASSNFIPVTDAPAGNFMISAASQSITLVATPSSIAVKGARALSFTGTSGAGAVTYSLVSGPCTLTQAPALLTGTGAGICVVTVTIAADNNYGSATSSPTSVTVSGPPTVTNVRAFPLPGSIQVVFDIVSSPTAASSVRLLSEVMYTATCASTDGGVTVSATGPVSPIDVTRATSGKSYTCRVTGTDGSGSSTSDSSNPVTPLPLPPNIIPTLGEWAQLIMMLMMFGAGARHTRRSNG